MALSDIPHCRPYHLEDVKNLYDVGEEYGITYSLTAIRTATTTATDASLEAFKSQWPFANEAAFDAAVDALKTTIAGNVTTNVPASVTAEKEYHDILDDFKADFAALVTSEGKTSACPECQTNGVAPTYNEDGSLTGDTIHSGVCDGYGYTEDAYILDGNAKRFIIQP